MAKTKSTFGPKWLDETRLDRHSPSDTPKYVSNLKKTVREVAAIVYSERGGNSVLYTKLRNAYLGVEDSRYSLEAKVGEPATKD